MTEQIKVTIDDIETTVPSGTTIIQAAEKVGIKIPTLCYHKDLKPSGNCRVCLVEVVGSPSLQAACAFPITAPVEIKTYATKVRNARRTVLELLLSEHCGECYSCTKSGFCELQDLAEEYGVKSYKYGHVTEPKKEKIQFSETVVYDANKCILCGRCVRTCNEVQKIGALGLTNRSTETQIATLTDLPYAGVTCINCGQCINRCPTGALSERSDAEKVWQAIEDPKKHVVIQTAPAPRAGIGECFGLEPGVPLTFQMNTALRRMGFDKVFDTNFSADLTIIEEGAELLLRLHKALVEKDASAKVPQFTSCSPGWINFIEYFYPEYLENLSSAKSPQQMFGAVIKTYYAKLHNIDPKDIVTVSLMPCTAKKAEAERVEMKDSGYEDVDYSITTREMAQMMKQSGITKLQDLPKSDFDDPFGTATGSGVIFGATGGVMEAALRTVIELVCGVKVENLFDHANIVPVRGMEETKIAELKIENVGEVPELLKPLFKDWNWLKGVTLKVGVTHGTGNARKVMEDIKAGGQFSECHFIEFMACPGGCLGGGGQPVPTDADIRCKRAKAIYDEDTAYEIRKSHENPAVVKLYTDFLTEGPCGHTSHKLLHTHYVNKRAAKS